MQCKNCVSELVPVFEKPEKVDSIQSKLTSLGPRFVVNSMRDLMSFCVCFKKCSKCEAEGDDFLFKGSLDKHINDCENGCTMADLKFQYGESEVRHLMALKELSDQYDPKNHAQALALDDNDDAYAAVQALITELDAEETQI